MTRFGFDENRLRRLVHGVRGDAAGSVGVLGSDGVVDSDASDADVVEAFARATWSMLAEPGDRAAGILTTALGAADALDAVIEGRGVEAMAAAVDPAASVERAALQRELADGVARWRPRLRSGDLVNALGTARRTGTRLLLRGDLLWPAGVDDLGMHAPLVLWVRGTASALSAVGDSIALVGARAATAYGEQIATEAAAGLSDRGVAIVSGAAYGIDGMAHRAALASGGTTIAFLAGGVDRFYPAGHDDLLTRISTAGAVVSELPCGSSPTKWRFLQRNRLIAAASQATVVLEAGWRSGSLNTAGHAAALGRPLGAVPGPITSVASAGCHRLIRDYDATCVTSVDEMLELLPGRPSGGPGASSPSGAVTADRTSDELRVIDALSVRTYRAPDELARRSGLAVGTVLGVLGALELDGATVRGDRGWRRRG